MKPNIREAPCFVCEKELKDGERKFMLGIDRPCVNIYAHYECWQNIKGNWIPFVTEKWDWIKEHVLGG